MTTRSFSCTDGPEAAERCRRDLLLARERAIALGRSALAASREGRYRAEDGAVVDMGDLMQAALRARRSLPPNAPLPARRQDRFGETRVSVCNESTSSAARRLVAAGRRTLMLNFANGVEPGGGVLRGACAQEESLCRSSGLLATLIDDPMYEAHRAGEGAAGSDWVILSPDVPFFRSDDGTALSAPWLAGVITCAAPVADLVGQPRAGDLLRARIDRVLAVASAFDYPALVLGAWGCGAFGNAPKRTARDFAAALAGPWEGAFSEVVFAIADWSPDRLYLRPFRDAFAAWQEGGR